MTRPLRFVPSPDGKVSRRELLGMAVPRPDATEAGLEKYSGPPYGSVTIDPGKCTGCALCAVECPTGGLSFAGKPGEFRLVFKPEICSGCARCQRACPENCLAVEKVMELAESGIESVVFQDGMVRCARCGGVIGPRVMIERVKAKLAGQALALEQAGLCPECKVREQFTAEVRAWKR